MASPLATPSRPVAVDPDAAPTLPRDPPRVERAAPRPADLATGVDALDAHAPFPAGEVAFVEAATPYLDRLLHGLVCSAARRGRRTVWVDGADALDVFDLSRAARARDLDPGATLGSVTVARGFTAYQVHALVEERLPEVLDASAGLVVAAGLPRKYLDEDVPGDEARDLLDRALEALQDAARDHGVPVVATHRGMARLHRRPALRDRLHEAPGTLLRLFPTPGGALARLPRRGETVRCPDPGAGQSLLERWGVTA